MPTYWTPLATRLAYKTGPIRWGVDVNTLDTLLTTVGAVTAVLLLGLIVITALVRLLHRL